MVISLFTLQNYAINLYLTNENEITPQELSLIIRARNKDKTTKNED